MISIFASLAYSNAPTLDVSRAGRGIAKLCFKSGVNIRERRAFLEEKANDHSLFISHENWQINFCVKFAQNLQLKDGNYPILVKVSLKFFDHIGAKKWFSIK
jgi:hypothetical protein